MQESGIATEHLDLRAAREMLKQIKKITQKRQSFTFETTLASLSYARKIPIWQKQGYAVILVYLRLPSVNHSIERVRRRIALGGHNILEQTIRRRFDKSLQYLDQHYKPLVDEWYVWDSLENKFEPAEAWNQQK